MKKKIKHKYKFFFLFILILFVYQNNIHYDFYKIINSNYEKRINKAYGNCNNYGYQFIKKSLSKIPEMSLFAEKNQGLYKPRNLRSEIMYGFMSVSVCLSLSVCLSFCPSVCLSVFLSFFLSFAKKIQNVRNSNLITSIQ